MRTLSLSQILQRLFGAQMVFVPGHSLAPFVHLIFSAGLAQSSGRAGSPRWVAWVSVMRSNRLGHVPLMLRGACVRDEEMWFHGPTASRRRTARVGSWSAASSRPRQQAGAMHSSSWPHKATQLPRHSCCSRALTNPVVLVISGRACQQHCHRCEQRKPGASRP